VRKTGKKPPYGTNGAKKIDYLKGQEIG